MYRKNRCYIGPNDGFREENYNSNQRCTKCGKNDHDYKICTNAIISFGIILLKFDIEDIKKYFKDLEKENDKIDLNDKSPGIKIKNKKDILNFSIFGEKIKFLIIKRKHTLGYIEFIRGRYKPNDIDGIVFLFQQMTKEEINKIGSLSITELWDNFWIDPNKKLLYDREYGKTKQKFEKLKNDENIDLKLDFYVKHINPFWNEPEWGFPKGRKNKLETNLECAIREFEEETGFKREDYTLLGGIKPIIEEFVGTNGVNYKHIYYVAYANTNKEPCIDKNNLHQISEIGDIGYYTYKDTINMIRPYHVEKKKAITSLYAFVIEKILTSIKLNDKKKIEINI